MKVLPSVVSQEACVRQPCLDATVGLLTSGSFHFPIGFLLPLRTPDLEAATRRMALCTDVAAFSQSLWRSVPLQHKRA